MPKRLRQEKRKKKLVTIHTKKMVSQMVLTYVKHVNHLRNDTGWSNCKCWYHDCCFATCFNSSLKQLYLVVWIVLLNYFMNFAAYFTYPNLLILTSSATYGTLMLITTTHWASLKIVSHNLLKKNITNHYIFTMPDQVSERSFLNKKSDCWVSSLLKVLHYFTAIGLLVSV